jgi:hypothetical protein
MRALEVTPSTEGDEQEPEAGDVWPGQARAMNQKFRSALDLIQAIQAKDLGINSLLFTLSQVSEYAPSVAEPAHTWPVPWRLGLRLMTGSWIGKLSCAPPLAPCDRESCG